MYKEVVVNYSPSFWSKQATAYVDLRNFFGEKPSASRNTCLFFTGAWHFL